MADTNYSNITNPYDDSLERRGSSDLVPLPSIQAPVQISSPSQVNSGVINEDSLNNLWIRSWIKSLNYKPKSQGFMIDGLNGIIKAMGMDIEGTITGAIVQTSNTDPRVILNGDHLIATDDLGNTVLEVILTGTDKGDVIIGNYAGGQGIKYDKSAGIIYYENVALANDTVHVNSVLSTIIQPRAEAFFKRSIFLGGASDGMTETPGGGTITRTLFRTVVFAINNSTAKLTGSLGADIDWNDMTLEFICTALQSANDTQDIFIGLVRTAAGDVPEDGILIDEHIGFFLADNVLTASNAEGTTQTSTVIAGVSLTSFNNYRFVYDGVDIKFYVNDILKATHTTNLPTVCTGGGGPFVFIGIEPHGGSSRTLIISNNYAVYGTT